MSAGRDRSEHPTIIVKRIPAHEEHHGGAWKVAYADFVTAMMALFIVLWLMASSQKIQQSVAGYFGDPRGNGKQTGTSKAGKGDPLALNRDNLNQLKNKLEQLMRQIPNFEQIKSQVNMTMTPEGLRIDLMETSGGMFFENGDPRPTNAGRELLHILAVGLAKVPNRVAIEGHTDSNPFRREDYSNWELSIDRANSARRTMLDAGLPGDRVSQVRGFADRRLLLKADPVNPSNRRVSIIVRNLEFDAHGEKVPPSPVPDKPAARVEGK